MSQAGSLTKNPTLLTAVLSLAAIAGYVTYRFTLGSSEQATQPAAAAVSWQAKVGAQYIDMVLDGPGLDSS